MARRTAMVPIESEDRDNGKLFLIKEMDAEQAEDWAFRVLLALVSNNVDLPEGFEELGMAGLAEVGLKALGQLKIETARPLLAEMLTCVEMIPNPKNTAVHRSLVSSDIEEVSTRIKLRMEVFKLHTDFSGAAVHSILGKKIATAARNVRVTRTSAK